MNEPAAPTSPPPVRPRRTVTRLHVVVLANLAVVLVLVALIEGLASLGVVGRELLTNTDYAERVYTEYDADLGWISLPAVERPNAFAPGVGVRTNRQRFRADREVPAELPADRLRLVAAGDSFTFGYGVANPDVWVEILDQREPWLETVNLAQGGYGLDQAFLRYRRDGALVAHDVAVLAFIANDFKRMEMDRFIGYDKPFLDLDAQGRLVVRNVPVPRGSAVRRGLARLAPGLRRLRSFELTASWFGAEDLPAEGQQTRAEIAEELHFVAEHPDRKRRQAIVVELIAEFGELARQRGAVPVLLYLPTRNDAEGTRGESREWRGVVRAASIAAKVPCFDLVDEVRRMPPGRRDRLFLSRELAADIQGHYTPEGNAWVAGQLPPRLRGVAELQRLAARRGVGLPAAAPRPSA